MSDVGAESITVTHRWAAGNRDVHVIDVQWIDSDRVTHGRRQAISDEQLRSPSRPVHVATETVPGVGFLVVDCLGVGDELEWHAKLIRGGLGEPTETYLVRIDWDDEDDDEELQAG